MDENAAKGLIGFAISAGRLKHTPRTGWSVRGLVGESVADHTYRTALLSSLVSWMLDREVDRGKLLEMALIHDLAEAYLGDWDHEAVDLLGRETKRKLEEEAVSKLISNLPQKVSRRLQAVWEEYQRGESLEAKIVHLADKLEAAIQALEYHRSGMKREIYEMFLGNLEELSLPKELQSVLQALLEALRNERDKA